MPISVTCQCGAKLEIDEKFLGKDISCPDCQRLLPTKASAAAPPPLETPDFRRTSGLAVLSLALALVGAFTIVGTIAAIVVGIFALKEIAARPTKVDGAHLARAGIIVGAVCTFLTLLALVSPTVFGLDVFLRELAVASRLQYPPGELIRTDVANFDVEIKRPKPAPLWGVLRAEPNQQNPNVLTDLLILVNTREDAYIACQSVDRDLNDDADALEKNAMDRFQKSELANLLSKNRGRIIDEPRIVEKKPLADGTQEIIFDIRMGGLERRCMMIYGGRKEDAKLNFLVGCARRASFDRLQDRFREAFAEFKVK